MPWNNQSGSGGPWGSGSRGPWGSGPQQPGGGSRPPDLEEFLRRSQDRLRGMLPGNLGGRGIALIALAAIVLWGFSGFFRVEPDELGVVLRFGKFVREVQPGLNYHLPYPIETALTPPALRVNKTDVGIRPVEDVGRRTSVRELPEESLMLTGDENIVDVDFSVLWRVKPNHVADYLFDVQNPEGTVKAVAESAMRQVIGRSNVQRLLTGGGGSKKPLDAQSDVETSVRELMQKTLDSYGAGILVQNVQLQKVNPPAEVLDSFLDVQAARSDSERAQNEAQTYANRVVPEARGRAAKITQDAEAYREQTVAEAKGETSRFLQIYDQYKKAPDVTRQRMYLETMERILGENSKTIIDIGKAGTGRGTVSAAHRIASAAPAAAQPCHPVSGGQLMRPGLAGGAIAVILLIAVVIGYSTLFTVSQTQQALVVRLGKPVRVITEPGLNVKVPFIDAVIYIDKRILNVESPAQEITLSSQDTSTRAELVGERLVVDAFVRYRITDPLKFYQTVGASGADAQLSILLNSALRRVLGAATLSDVVRDKRDELMKKMRDQLDFDAKPFGIEIVDVRIRRADLPKPNSQAVYQRMQTERQREAAEFRAQGSQKSQEIRAKADRDVTVLLADATSHAEQVRGEGDSERNRIFADAYGRDPDFFGFYRSMQAYEKSMQRGDTRLVLRPDSDFFRYFSDPSGRPAPNQQAAPPTPPGSK